MDFERVFAGPYFDPSVIAIRSARPHGIETFMSYWFMTTPKITSSFSIRCNAYRIDLEVRDEISRASKGSNHPSQLGRCLASVPSSVI